MLSKAVAPDSLFILPTVSVGNASQRAIDLLIHNYQIPVLCHIDALDCFLPMICSDPFDIDSTAVVSTCMAYYCSEKKLLIFQFRSDFVAHMRVEFFKRLIDFINKHNFRSIILLTSSWAPARSAPQMINPGIFYLRCAKATKTDDQLRALSLTKVSEEPELNLPGSGFAVELYQTLRNTDQPLLVLVKYCDEGWQNAIDAIEIFESLVAVEFDRSQIKYLKKPYTWQM